MISTVLFVQQLDLLVESTLTVTGGVICLVQKGNSSKMWPWQFGERVQCNSVQSDANPVNDDCKTSRDHERQGTQLNWGRHRDREGSGRFCSMQ